MRIPEPLFVVINVVVRLLLRSPLHSLMSDSVLLINYVGRKSGRAYSTPVRYLRSGGRIRCITTEEVQWWRNLQATPAVTLLVQGEERPYTASVIRGDSARIEPLLAEFFSVYHQDAVYQDTRLNKEGTLDRDDLEKASHSAVVVEFEEV